MSRYFNKTVIIGFTLSVISICPLVLDYTLTLRFLLISLSLFFVCIFFLQYRTSIITELNIVTASLFGYMLFCILSVFWALNKQEAIFEAARTSVWVFVFFFSYYIIILQNKKIVSSILKVTLILPVIELVVAVYQISQNNYGFLDDSIYAVTGLNGHKNLFASILFLNLFFVIVSVISFKGFWKNISVCALIISIVIIVILKSKAVYIGCLVALATAVLVYVIYKLKITFRFLPAFIGTMLFINLIFFFCLWPFLKSKTTTEHMQISKTTIIDKSIDYERFQLWDKSFEIFKNHPIKGIGCGNWQIWFPSQTLNGIWRAEDLNFTFQRPHNDFLWILTETGIIGFNLYLSFIVSVLCLLLCYLKTVTGKVVIIVGLCIVFILGYLSISFFDFPKERVEHLIYVSLIFAVAYSLIQKSSLLINYISLKITKQAMIVPIVMILLCVIIGWFRIRGEYFTRKLYESKNRGLYTEVINYALKAKNFAYSIDPTSLPLEWYSGNAKAILKKYDLAKNDFEKSYVLNPYNRNVINDLASACVLNKDTIRAEKLYLEAIHISPRFDDPILNVMSIYINQKRYNEAKQCLVIINHKTERSDNFEKTLYTLIKAENLKKQIQK